MRAVVVHEFGPVETLKLEEAPDPIPGAGEVLIDVHAVGLNFSDRLMIQGKYQIRPNRPFSPGRDASGVVARVGAGVTRCKPGDRVMTVVPFGAYAERLVAPQARCFVLPDALDFIAAAAMGNAHMTAYVAAMERGGLKASERVLVTGASGGIGLAAVEIVAAVGAFPIAGVTSAEKGALALRHGAVAWVDLAKPNLLDSLRDQVNAATEGKGVNMVLDPVGGDVFDAALRTLAPGGRIVVIGFAEGRIPEVKTNYLLLKNLTVAGCNIEPFIASAHEIMEGAVADLFIMYLEKQIKPEVAAVYPLADFRTALDLFGTGRVRGKVVLTTGRS